MNWEESKAREEHTTTGSFGTAVGEETGDISELKESFNWERIRGRHLHLWEN